MRVHWTDEAKAQPRAIEAHIARESPGVARRTVARLAKRCRQIADLPHTGRMVPGFGRSDLRELLERPYRIIYRIKSGQIDIVTLRHYRQLLPGDLA